MNIQFIRVLNRGNDVEGCAVFALQPRVCADDGRFLDLWKNIKYWDLQLSRGGVQSCLSQLFLHYPIFQNNLKQGFDCQSKSPTAQWY